MKLASWSTPLCPTVEGVGWSQSGSGRGSLCFLASCRPREAPNSVETAVRNKGWILSKSKTGFIDFCR